MDEGSWREVVRRARTREERRLVQAPAWAATLAEVLVDLGPPPVDLAGVSPPIAALWPFTVVGAARLDAMLPPDTLGLRARQDLLEQLGRRLLTVAMRSFDQELQADRASHLLLGLAAGPATLGHDGAAWRARLLRVPVLGRLLAVTLDHWASACARFLRDLVDDAGALTDLAGGSLLPVRTIEADAGDQHDEGRTVLLVHGTGGTVVYKPKQLDIGPAWQALAQAIGLPTRSLLVREGHSWEAFVAHRPCADVDGIARFYWRMGATLRVLQLLAARDFWLDNLVAHGDEPHFVDLEMALQPLQFRPLRAVLSVENDLMRAMEETVVPTGVVTYRSPIEDGVEAVDLGALSPQRELVSPYRLGLAESDDLGIQVGTSESGHITWSKSGFVPVTDQGPAVPSAHLEEVVGGYREAHARLRELGSRLDVLLDGFEGCDVRLIVRDTWTCQRLLQESVSPSLLDDGLRREAWLERLFRGARTSEGIDPRQRAIVAEEIRQLLDLDVPMFTVRATERHLRSRGRVVVEDDFTASPLAVARSRAAALDTFDLEHHVAVLRTCFATGDHPPPPVPGRVGSGASRIDGLALARALADGVVEQAWQGEEGAMGWLGLVDQPLMRVRSIEPLRPTLAGTAGWARLFAHLARVTGEGAYRRAARGALASTVHCARLAIERWTVAPPDLARTELGFVIGVGAQLVALRDCGDLLGDAELQRLARDYADVLPDDASLVGASGTPWRWSAAGGVVGLLAALVELGHPRAPGLARALASVHVTPIDLGQAWAGSGPWTGVPDSEALLAASLARLDVDRPEVPWGDTVGARLLRASRPVRLDLASASTTDLLDALELDLHHETRGTDLSGHILATFVERREGTGSWTPDRHSADRHDLSILDGLGSLAWSALRTAVALPSPRLPFRSCDA